MLFNHIFCGCNSFICVEVLVFSSGRIKKNHSYCGVGFFFLINAYFFISNWWLLAPSFLAHSFHGIFPVRWWHVPSWDAYLSSAVGRAWSQGLHPGDGWFLLRVGEAKISLCRQKVHSRRQRCVCIHSVTTMWEQWTVHSGPSTLPPCWEETADPVGAASLRTHTYRLLCLSCLLGLPSFW